MGPPSSPSSRLSPLFLPPSSAMCSGKLSSSMTKPLPDSACVAATPERKYYKQNQIYAKRYLRPTEYWARPNGETIIPRAPRERIENEAASLLFIKDKTDIPVPEVYGLFEDSGACWLITEYIEGVDLATLPEEQKLVVITELESHLAKLRGLKSSTIGGPTGIIAPPYRVTLVTKQDTWNLRSPSNEEYGFCHNDLSQNNVIVDPDTLRIKAIIDWEYAGFYPDFFEGKFYRRPGPSDALEKYNEKSDTPKLVDFLESLHDELRD